MFNSIELLTVNLLDDQDKLSEIDYWLRVMDRPQGWHYDMDIIWLLKGLEEAGVAKGATILDAGAGMGITQFVLASRGYNIISLDFTPRIVPPLTEGIFEIEADAQDRLDYEHKYMSFIKYRQGQHIANSFHSGFIMKAQRALTKGFGYLYSRIKHHRRRQKNLRVNEAERQRDHRGFGKIRFLRAAFHEIPLETSSVDALVSVSAIEHADKELLEKNIGEMMRVVKKDGPLLITTSATSESEDWFHDKTQGWCFSAATLAKLVANDKAATLNYREVEQEILASALWRERIDPIYANDPASEFYRRNITALPYLPVGLTIYH